MIGNDRRVRIVTGHYGSGKTEFAVNYARELSRISDKKVALADLDVVNPYFRSREKAQVLQDLGIEVIASSESGSALDLPAVSARVMGPMENKDIAYIIDVGGDAVGSRALARFRNSLDPLECEVFMVVNANREQTSTVEGVLQHQLALEGTTRLKVTGYINNTHLIRQTTLEDILRGDALLGAVSAKTQVPVRYVSFMDSLLEQVKAHKVNGQLFPLALMMRESWM